jgi:DNA repair protein RecN (Recombination protein N)
LSGELQTLALGKATCEFHLESLRSRTEAWTDTGIDGGELYFAPNVGEAPRPLARIASGGEMSRVMLGIKTLVGVDAPGRTLVFDEVDSGIGGRAADAVGSRLRLLGRTQQVLCITHLPQVAAHASSHFVVEKAVRNNRTVTTLGRLDSAARVEELARMIGGADVTPQVRASAREMLATRAKGEAQAKGESERAKAKG